MSVYARGGSASVRQETLRRLFLNVHHVCPVADKQRRRLPRFALVLASAATSAKRRIARGEHHARFGRPPPAARLVNHLRTNVAIGTISVERNQAAFLHHVPFDIAQGASARPTFSNVRRYLAVHSIGQLPGGVTVQARPDLPTPHTAVVKLALLRKPKRSPRTGCQHDDNSQRSNDRRESALPPLGAKPPREFLKRSGWTNCPARCVVEVFVTHLERPAFKFLVTRSRRRLKFSTLASLQSVCRLTLRAHLCQSAREPPPALKLVDGLEVSRWSSSVPSSGTSSTA